MRTLLEHTLATALCLAAASVVTDARADSIESTCVIYPAGEDHTDVMIPCVFSQRQGHVNIRRDDGVEHRLSPEEGPPGNFLDDIGNRVYRQSGLGDQGQIFRFPTESIYVYWGRSRLEQADSDNPTAPFSTSEYDATTLLPCSKIDGSAEGSCPAGILRMKDQQASIVVKNLDGEIFTINFLTDTVNATNRKAEASFDGDTWTVIIDEEELFIVPLAAIEGG